MWRPSWRPSWILKKPSGWQVATQQKTYLDIKYYGKIAKLDCNQTLQAFLELWDPATGLHAHSRLTMSQPTWWRGGRGLPSLIALLLLICLWHIYTIWLSIWESGNIFDMENDMDNSNRQYYKISWNR